LNAQYPAAVGARVLVAHYIQCAVFRALQPLLPDRVIADSAAPTWVPVLSGVNQYGQAFVEILIVHGGIGARPAKDGMVVSYPDHPPSTAVEIFENEKPLLVERKELIADSAGPGRFRGGCGQYFRFRVMGDAPVRLGMRADRIDHPPLGFAGGRAGRAGRATLNDGEPLHPKRTVFIQPGDVVDLQTPGGGGFFDPRERDPAAVRRDVADGLVSPEAAAETYGVAGLPEPRD
jgi:N-methylhydantoinase B